MTPTAGHSRASPVVTTMAPNSRAAFVDAWFRRVREVDDATISHLLRLLLQLRRIKLVLAGAGFAGGGLWAALLPVPDTFHHFLIGATFSSMLGMPALGAGTLAVRRIFLRESMRLGLSRSSAMLLLTRAERKERTQFLPMGDADERVEQLLRAVRAWDEA